MRLKPKHWDFLAALPDFMDVTLLGKRLYMTHSLPGDCVTYLRDPKQLPTEFLQSYDFYAFGHTHIPLVQWHLGTQLINPGSVGQPRDYTQTPSFAMLNLATDTTTVVKIPVDVAGYAKVLSEKGIDASMIHVLTRSRY
jgi:predicted phosphodiesterase